MPVTLEKRGDGKIVVRDPERKRIAEVVKGLPADQRRQVLEIIANLRKGKGLSRN